MLTHVAQYGTRQATEKKLAELNALIAEREEALKAATAAAEEARAQMAAAAEAAAEAARRAAEEHEAALDEVRRLAASGESEIRLQQELKETAAARRLPLRTLAPPSRLERSCRLALRTSSLRFSGCCATT